MTVNIYYLSNQPVKGLAFSFITGLYSQADTKLLQDNPTLAAGDVIVIKDGVLDGNIDALPVAIAGVTRALLVTVSAAENDCDYGGLVLHDVTDAEWCDAIVYWSTVQAVGVGTSDLAAGAQMDLVDNAVDAGAVKADAVTKIQSGLATSANQTTILARIGAWTGSGVNTILGAFKALLSKDASAPSDIGGTFTPTTDSTEALAEAFSTATDPLENAVPGSYASGTAGHALGRIGSGQITTVSPVAQNGDVEMYQGDDYDNADGRALDWTDVSAAWPDLTGATIAVIINGVGTFAGSVVTPTGASKKVRLELTSIQTLTIPIREYSFQVQATQSVALGSDEVTLVEAKWNCKKKY